MRGEHEVQQRTILRVGESSPHAREAPPVRTGCTFICGIIPACAGSTSRAPAPWRGCRDHPRMRGEHAESMSQPARTSGSSPHARGALPRGSPMSRAPGIIPACAGSTRSKQYSSDSHSDHPRMRGEHLLWLHTSQLRSGSSPHARGARTIIDADGNTEGIIPACAGSTSRATRGIPRGWDHPRMRGEHLEDYGHTHATLGSSPHARGALVIASNGDWSAWIIPACAGSTLEDCLEREQP